MGYSFSRLGYSPRSSGHRHEWFIILRSVLGVGYLWVLCMWFLGFGLRWERGERGERGLRGWRSIRCNLHPWVATWGFILGLPWPLNDYGYDFNTDWGAYARWAALRVFRMSLLHRATATDRIPGLFVGSSNRCPRKRMKITWGIFLSILWLSYISRTFKKRTVTLRVCEPFLTPQPASVQASSPSSHRPPGVRF